MIKRIDYTYDAAGNGHFTTFKYNASGVEQIVVNGDDVTTLEVSYASGKISEVKTYEKGKLICTGVFTYAGNTIRIDHQLFETAESPGILESAERMLQPAAFETRSKAFFRTSMPPTTDAKAVTEIILNGTQPELITLFVDLEETGVLVETFKTEYTITAAATRYEVLMRDGEDPNWYPFMGGTFTDFENTDAPVADNLIFLAFSGMYNGGILSYLYCRDAGTFNRKNYRKHNFTFALLGAPIIEIFTNTISAGNLTEKNLVPEQSTEPGVQKVTFTY
jgi:hypothetical protein